MSKKLKPLMLGDLRVEIPLIQGGMGVKVSTAALASAVAACGAAGTIAGVGLGYGTAMNDEDYYRASREALAVEIVEAKKATRGVVGVNAMVALCNFDDLVKTAVAEKADFISSGAGLPLRLPELAENSPVKLLPIVSSARAAGVIVKTWKKRYDRLPDALIVEGPLAGGHLGFKSEELKPARQGALEAIVADVVKMAGEYRTKSGAGIPVVAAGGVFTGKDMARFIRLGASGVQIATRFVATHECSVPDNFKQAYLKASDEDVVIIDSPVGMPGRALRNKFIDKVSHGEKIPYECTYQCLKTCDPSAAPYCIAKALFNAANGDLDNAVIFCGSNVSRVNKIVSVRELIDEIVNEAVQELG